MSKIIIDNNTNGRLNDISCMRRVEKLIRMQLNKAQFKDGTKIRRKQSKQQSYEVYI